MRERDVPPARRAARARHRWRRLAADMPALRSAAAPTRSARPAPRRRRLRDATRARPTAGCTPRSARRRLAAAARAATARRRGSMRSVRSRCSAAVTPSAGTNARPVSFDRPRRSSPAHGARDARRRRADVSRRAVDAGPFTLSFRGGVNGPRTGTHDVGFHQGLRIGHRRTRDRS